MSALNPNPSAMKTDTLFYHLFQTLPELALQLAGIPADQAQGYAFRAEEVKQTAFRLDGLLIPPPDAQLSLEQTEALAEAVFDFQTAADLTAWLAALPERKTSSPETRD